MRISPSEPTPKCRSLILIARRRDRSGAVGEAIDVDVVVADAVHLGETHESETPWTLTILLIHFELFFRLLSYLRHTLLPLSSKLKRKERRGIAEKSYPP